MSAKRTKLKWKRNVLNAAVAMAISGMAIAPTSSGSVIICGGVCSGTTSGTTNGLSIGTLDSLLTNSGVITVSAIADVSSSAAEAYGMEFLAITSTGSLTNAGTIDISTTTLNPVNNSAYAAGINIDNALDGTLTNTDTGTISVTAAAAYSAASAVGISAGSIGVSGVLTNDNSISVTAIADQSIATAYGIFIYGALSGSLVNSGSISAQASGANFAFAHGIYAGTLDGTLINDGSINASAISSGSATSGSVGAIADAIKVINLVTLTNSGMISASTLNLGNASGGNAYAYARAVYGSEVNSLSNSGIISASATNAGSALGFGVFNSANFANAIGIDVSGGNIATLTNAHGGTIDASAINSGNAYGGITSASAGAYAIFVNFGGVGTMNNGGAVSATAINLGNASSGSAHAVAYGLYRFGGSSGTLMNSGTISVTALNSGNAGNGDAYVDAYAIYEDHIFYLLTNSGTISASATNSGNALSGIAYANAYGIHAGMLSDTLTNNSSGAISAVAINADGTANAYAVHVGTLFGTLTNSGTIAAVATGSAAYAYSIYANNGAGNINNLAGGLLSGNIYTGGTVAVSNAGTIALPVGANDGSAAGAGHIFGTYNQTTGGVLQIAAANNTDSYGQLVVDGEVTFDGSNSNTIRVQPTLGNTMASGDVLEDVVSAGSWSGLASGGAVNVTSTSPLLTFTGVEDTFGHIDISVASTNTFSGLYGSLGSVLDGLLGSYGSGNVEMDALIDKLYGMNSATDVNNAIKQLQPHMTAGIPQITVDTLHGTSNVILARLDESRGLASGDDFATSRNAWVKPLGSWADQNDDNLVSGYSAKTYGVVLGADGALSQASRLGAAFAFTNTKADSNDGWQTTKVNGYQAVLYGTHDLDERTNLDWQTDYGHNQNKGARITIGGTAAADYTSSSMHAGIGVARTMPINPATTFKPSVRADYATIRENGYTETGAGALNLVVGGRNTSEFILGADGKVIHALSDTSKLIANLGLGYNTQAKQSSITSAFQGGGAAFTTLGIAPSKTVLRGGVGVVVNTSKTMEVTARYDFESRSGFIGQTASAKLSMPF